MTCSFKQMIRLNKVSQRLNKVSYKRLKPEEYKLIKLIEREEQCEKDKNKFWLYVVRDENGAASEFGNDWEFFKYF